jgi:uncharacterized Zn finger protein
MSYYGFRPYVPVAMRRALAAREMEKLRKTGRVITPVTIAGRAIARNFWGKAWCENLERYSDFENRLPRGRTYVRNGSVVDLQIERGRVRAMVSGAEIYEVKIDITTVASSRWKAICADCARSIGSLVELLQGKLSKNVMERVCREGEGLFPAPSEIKMSCTCPDWAGMCKHVAATLYGAGARFDAVPDLLFALRGVDCAELIKGVSADLPTMQTLVTSERILANDDVAALFGIEIAPSPDVARTPAKKRKASAQRQTTLVQAEQSGAHGKKTPPKAPGRRMREPVEPNSLKAARATSALAAAKKTPARENGLRTSGEARKATSAKNYVPSAVATPEEPPSQPERREGKAKAELRRASSKAARWIGARARRARERL